MHINVLSRALAAAPVALEKMEEAAEAAEAACGAGAGAGEALTAVRTERAARSAGEDSMLGKDQEDEDVAGPSLAFYNRGQEMTMAEIKTRSGYAPHHRHSNESDGQ